jgi:GNAT superfamily N-acetyltransferase
VRIRPPAEAELALLRDIEVRAGEPFRAIGMAAIADDDPPATGDLRASLDAGLAWVAAEADDRPVAYLLVAVVDGALHVEQVSVDPAWARRGIGGALLEHAAAVAAKRGLGALTLTTFAEVPWNAPYYARCGFRALGEEELTPGLRAIVAAERARGLDRWPRVVMRRPV